MIHDIPERTEVWHKIRAENIGGSEVAALLGVQADYQMSAYTLWQTKSGRIPERNFDNPRMEIGRYMEPFTARKAAETRGWSIYKGGYATDDECPGAGASLDYVIEAPGEEELDLGYSGPGVLEIKCINWLQWKTKWTADAPPPYTLVQLQHQLGCSGYEWGAVVVEVLGGDDRHIYPYLRRPKIIERGREAVTAFWQAVRDGKPPAVDDTESTKLALRAAFPDSIYAVTDWRDDLEAAEIAHQLHEARQGKREMERAETLALNRLHAKLENIVGAVMIDGWHVTVSVDKKGARRVTVKEYLGK